MTRIRVRGTSFPRALFYLDPGFEAGFLLFRRVFFLFDNSSSDLELDLWSKFLNKQPFWKQWSHSIEAIPPHHSLIDHLIRTQKEPQAIVMIAWGSLFLGRLKRESRPFWSPFFIFLGLKSPSQALPIWLGLGGQVGEDLRIQLKHLAPVIGLH